MNTLFMIGLGGSIKTANIEVHDMQFVLAENKDDAIEQVVSRWYGDSLHIDSYTEINVIDNYTIDFTTKSERNLYLIIYGGYKKGTIDELHDYHFLLAGSLKEAKLLAEEQYSLFPNMDHVDNIVNMFENLNTRFGFIKSNAKFKDNHTTHTYIKIR